MIRPNTTLVWCESPGSVTMEVQDLPAIVAAAHERTVPVALDNTYAAGVLLDAFSLGVDVSMQALTKYVGGHSDLLLGTVSVSDEAGYNAVGAAHAQLGMAVSPDDCSLALRGLETLGVRLERLRARRSRSRNGCRASPESRPFCTLRCPRVPVINSGSGISPVRQASFRLCSSSASLRSR